MSLSHDSLPADALAIVGMAGRFPGAPDLETLWRNLRDGVESIRHFTPEELLADGVPAELVHHPDYVPAAGLLEDSTHFDAEFFGMNPRQAETTDPQHRLFLEAVWHALENAGLDPLGVPGRVGLYGGMSTSSYRHRNLEPRPDVLQAVGHYQLLLSNDKDFLATQVAYRLDLHGPAVTVQTACSTSLVATHVACQALLNGECNLALAGGVSMTWPRKRGDAHREGGILAPDGHCRAFDARAAGTVVGQGVGVVVLERLEDALAKGRSIRALVRGSAINNDGSAKAGYTAPSVQRQREVIAEALGVAGVDAGSIGYVEAHGTGTELGDPIEVTALTEAFRESTDGVGFCGLGSIKTNLGHLDAAAGVTGLIKAVLALEHGELPPSLHFETPNPRLDLERSPFFVAAERQPWPIAGTPRRAGVSSFGIGGTNAHVVLEQAPPPGLPAPAARTWHFLPLSARTPSALETLAAELARHLRSSSGGEAPPAPHLADVAHTLAIGRHAFEHRRVVICREPGEAADLLARPDPTRTSEAEAAEVVFLFPGQGSQYVGMGRELYEHEEVFRREIDHCSEVLEPLLGLDPRDVLYPAAGGEEEAAQRLERTDLTQPALFAFEYALARQWMAWGVRPGALLGHSIGEYVAATLAGVFSLDDALALVAARGHLLAELPGGVMLGVSLAEEELRPLVGEGLDLAVVNAPKRAVVAGDEAAVAALEAILEERGVPYRRLRTSQAFHSAAMDGALAPLAEQVARRERQAPTIPFLSNLTGTWITPAEAIDPDYWSRHLRHTVRFSENLEALGGETHRVLLEVGPGATLSMLARQHGHRRVVASMPKKRDSGSETEALITAAAQLWLHGAALDAEAFYGPGRRRVPLPVYPFERRPYWIEPPKPTISEPSPPLASPKEAETVEALIERQLDILNHQLELLRRTPS